MPVSGVPTLCGVKLAATLHVPAEATAAVVLQVVSVALSRARPAHQVGPLAAMLSARCQRLVEAFYDAL